jgi:hypothetical protein
MTEEECKAQIKKHEEWCRLQIETAERHRDKAIGLLALAHLDLMQHLKYGFNPKTAHSTLISVGEQYPRLKTEMDKLELELKNDSF